MRGLVLAVLIGSSGAVLADDRAVEAAVHASFNTMPVVERLPDISQACGASGQANPDVTYCTTRNIVYLRIGAENVGYLLAHVMGHAAQVRHGIADIALREIRKRSAEEMFLRGLVTRQVECLAGVYLAKAGLPSPDLNTIFTAEPFTKSHWGRSPLRIGPQVSIGIEARQEWLNIGHAAKSVADCSVGEISADLLVQAFKS